MGTASHFADYAKWLQSPFLETSSPMGVLTPGRPSGCVDNVGCLRAGLREAAEKGLPTRPSIAGDFSLWTFVHIRINQQGWPHVSRFENRFSPVTLLSQFGRSVKPPLSVGDGVRRREYTR